MECLTISFENKFKSRVSAVKCPDFGDVLKIDKYFSPCIKGHVHSTGVIIQA
jgi:hypothetical protein